MAYTFQITSVFQRLTVFENVAVALRRRDDQGGAETQDAVDEVLARTGLSGTGGQLASELSYGHQRLLELAMGLAQRPRLLILDEPTQGLAEAEVAAFKALVRGLVPEVTVLLIEHNMGVVMELATRISVLNFGRLLAEGTPDEVRADASVREAYLGGAHA
jgi:branched-chain amino acid transport system ATP-binding protein